ncbi:MAG TPA: alkaline phosphatase family protein [Myxococcales bacterium]
MRPCSSSVLKILLCSALACGSGAGDRPASAEARRSATAASPIQHVVVLMMENRSFDHFLGWVPGADGRQAGLTFTDGSGVPHSTFPLAPDFQGCLHPDPDHSYAGGRVEYDNGLDDGWLRAGANDVFAIGYYTQPDLAFFGQAVPQWTTFDRYYPAILSETFPNRIYQHAGQTDRISNTFEPSTLPTIWDRLADAGLRGRYYYSDLPFLALWGSKYLGISHSIQDFYADAAAGNLPEVAFVDGQFAGEATGTGNDDHPHVDIRNGEKFMNDVYGAVTRSPQWSSTVLFINFDEWGGFFDHVSPPTAPIPPATRAAGDTDGRLGFRVPALLVAPWARSNTVSHRQYDHTSVLRMIEQNWDLKPLSMRDASANNLAQELDFTLRRIPPQFAVPQGPFGVPCPSEGPGNGLAEATGLRDLAVQNGFPVF